MWRTVRIYAHTKYFLPCPVNFCDVKVENAKALSDIEVRRSEIGPLTVNSPVRCVAFISERTTLRSRTLLSRSRKRTAVDIFFFFFSALLFNLACGKWEISLAGGSYFRNVSRKRNLNVKNVMENRIDGKSRIHICCEPRQLDAWFLQSLFVDVSVSCVFISVTSYKRDMNGEIIVIYVRTRHRISCVGYRWKLCGGNSQ